MIRRLSGPAYLREERARVPRGVRPAQERGHLRPGRLTARAARRRQARDDQEAPVRLPRADGAAHRLVRGARRCCAASTARARPTRCTPGSARRSRRCGSRPSSSHDPAQDAGGDRQDGRGGADPRPLPRAAAQEGAPGRHDRRARRGRRALHPLPERRARLQGLPRLPRLDLRLAQLDGRARDPRPLRAEARRHPLDRHRRDPRRLGRGRGDHPPDRQRHADRLEAARGDEGFAVRRGRTVPARQPPRRRVARRPGAGRVGGLLR